MKELSDMGNCAKLNFVLLINMFNTPQQIKTIEQPRHFLKKKKVINNKFYVIQEAGFSIIQRETFTYLASTNHQHQQQQQQLTTGIEYKCIIIDEMTDNVSS